jgi:hypothetical protein
MTFVRYLLLGFILLLLPYRLLFTSYVSVFILAFIVSCVVVYY